MYVVSRAALVTSLALMSAPLAAQEEPQPPAMAMVRATSPDIHALRYYAKLGDTERYQLELERLRRLYPGFTPPANLNAEEINYEQELWDLYGEGRIEELKRRLEEIRELDTSWAPSAALERELNRRTTRGDLLMAYKNFDAEVVKQLANENPLLINPDDPEVVWAVAETFALEQDMDAAIQAFTFAVTTAKTDDVRAGALQKAAQHLPIENASALYTLAKVQFSEDNIDEALDIGFARGLVIRSNQYGNGFPEDYIDIINFYMQRAMANGWIDDIEVLSWTLYNQRQYLPALALFQKSLEISPDPKTVEGVLLSLKHLDRVDEARPIASEWRTATNDIAHIYLNLWAPILLQPDAGQLQAEFLQTFALTTNEVASGEGAEALGWYAYNVQQFPAAGAWFGKAMEWELTETAVLGSMLTASAVKDKATFDALQAQYGVQYPKLAEQLYEPVFEKAKEAAPVRRSQTRVQTFTSSITAAYEAKNYQRCVELSDRQIRAGRVGPRDYQMRGWCLMALKRPAEAQEAFERAIQTDRSSSTNKDKQASVYGASLAALERGRTDNAFEIASANGLDGKQRRTVDKEVLTQRAIAAFRARDYHSVLYALDELRKIAPVPRNLSELRGWSLHYLGDRNGAIRVFESLDSIYSTPDTKRALQTVRAGRR